MKKNRYAIIKTALLSISLAAFILSACAVSASFAASSLAGFSSDTNDYSFEFYDSDNGLINQHITSLAPDNKGSIYTGTWGGIMKFDGSIFAKIEGAGGRVEGVAPQFVSALFYDAKTDTLWIGSMFNKNAGLFKYHNGHFTRYSMIDGMPSDNVSAVCAGGGKIYAGTWGGGIAVFDGTKFEVLNRKNGLSDNYITSLAYSEKTSALWAASKFSGANLIKDGRVTVMDDHTSSLVNNYVHKLVLDDAENMVYFGTSGGVSKFNGAAWQNVITGPDTIGDNFIKDIFICKPKSFDRSIVYYITANDVSVSFDNAYYNIVIKKLSGRDLELNAVAADENYIYLATDRGLCKIGRR
ncbi:MAG: hypothetical protein A2008_06645 [Candidatus Wallbacteria bacterium GWC2_49_35]|uniref:Uncharacterized protein n=1 Tax=Candidatus Wallbacteria bacterium GWC2_49_35 TaxID=1817813 RepID=A0A1F7WLA6_9BACT|nr:MAG: hypothetical protein A2008_06645 [Candidatus Wallbacteria bacterium GWC2_49_35]HBC76921.1 hypothetical protein [Candidatus Wallbacteria bacterium]